MVSLSPPMWLWPLFVNRVCSLPMNAAVDVVIAFCKENLVEVMEKDNILSALRQNGKWTGKMIRNEVDDGAYYYDGAECTTIKATIVAAA